MKMEKLFNQISILFGLIGGVLTYWLGGWDVLLKTIVFLAVVDYITGLIKGIYLKKLSSEIGFKGLLKKIVMFIVIAVAFVIQELALYLDTHRDDQEALELYQNYQEMYHKCMMEYTKNCRPKNHFTPTKGKTYQWLDDPWPWEYAANKEG